MNTENLNVPTKKGSRVWLWAAIGLVLMLAAGACANQPAVASLPAEVNVARAAELRDQGAFMLDVREPVEWQELHIPGATLIPLGELASRVSEVPKDQPIVVYCRSGNRSQSGRDILKQAGFQNVTSMAGGVNDWYASGYEVESGQ